MNCRWCRKPIEFNEYYSMWVHQVPEGQCIPLTCKPNMYRDNGLNLRVAEPEEIIADVEAKPVSGNVDLHDHTGWYGFDLDGTIAKYDHWRGPGHIGEPIMPMVNLIKKMLAEGKKIKIFTARAYFPQYDERRQKEVMVARMALREWCLEHIGQELEMTNTKDFSMLGLFDDRAIQVEFNTGRIIGA